MKRMYFCTAETYELNWSESYIESLSNVETSEVGLEKKLKLAYLEGKKGETGLRQHVNRDDRDIGRLNEEATSVGQLPNKLG